MILGIMLCDKLLYTSLKDFQAIQHFEKWNWTISLYHLHFDEAWSVFLLLVTFRNAFNMNVTTTN